MFEQIFDQKISKKIVTSKNLARVGWKRGSKEEEE